ncbi:MAG TPA: Y-family DNA polymerase [Pyrinomonadaceae bacterium]|jgi:DNA polymerase V
MQTAIGSVDANNFYVSCERAFDPMLLGRPVVVLSNNDGCIIARSEEAKAAGVGMGAPLFKTGRSVEEHGVAVYSSNYALYGDMSRRVMEALEEFTPEVEVYSIDEAFMRLEPAEGESLRSYGLEVREKVRRWTGIPVSIGIAPTKTLSKVANRHAKRSPDATQGVLDLTGLSEQTRALEETPVGDVWGVGPAYSKMLNAAGIISARQLRDADRRWVRRRMTVVGARIVEELRGVSCLPLEQCPQGRKSVTCSRSFGATVESLGELREAVGVYMTRAAERLRKHRMAAAAVTVFINTSRFGDQPRYGNSATHELACATDSTEELLDWALKGLERIYRPGYKYKKAGVVLCHLIPADCLTMHLFGDADFERSRRVMRAVDEINRRHGRDTVRLGVAREGRWKTKFLRRSRRYTTCLNEVLTIQ